MKSSEEIAKHISEKGEKEQTKKRIEETKINKKRNGNN